MLGLITLINILFLRRGGYGQDVFTLRSTYLQGRPPKSVHLYWRRFAASSIPLQYQDEFDKWLRDRWVEKDELIEHYLQHGSFPVNSMGSNANSNGVIKDQAVDTAPIHTEVKLQSVLEVTKIFAVLAAFGMVMNVLIKMWNLIRYGAADAEK
jgi:hypothetical protein